MDLTTQCPQCGTIFLASLEQLQLRKGYIRCVQCAHIFDGYEAVVPAGATASGPSEPVPSPSVPSVPTPSPIEPSLPPEPVSLPVMPSVVRARREFTISDPRPVELPDTEPTLSVSGIMAREPESAHDEGVEPVIADWDNVYVKVDADARAGSARHAGRQRERDTVESSRWHSVMTPVWWVLITAGVLVLVAQLVYVFRVQLAESIPVMRPSLERMCATLRCTVAYSRQPDMIVITHSSLQGDSGAGDDNSDDNTLLLQLTLRNAYDKPQEWPTLVLDLKDFSGTSIARKNLPKDVYLPALIADKPFPASSEQKVALPLTMQGLKVNGYQLTAFFP